MNNSLFCSSLSLSPRCRFLAADAFSPLSRSRRLCRSSQICYHRDLSGRRLAKKLDYIKRLVELGKDDLAPDSFDSFLLVSVKPIDVNLLVGRTAELADYLSNGLPGKGMGVAGGAAKGFFKEKVRMCEERKTRAGYSIV